MLNDVVSRYKGITFIRNFVKIVYIQKCLTMDTQTQASTDIEE